MVENLARRGVRPLAVLDRPIYALLLPVAIICFLGAVLTDWAYLGSDGNLTWLFFSTWLIPTGLVFGAISAVVLAIDAIRSRGGWITLVLLLVAWVVELINVFIHMRDGWTAVAGLGFILSIIGALLALASGWFAADARVPARREA